MDELGAKRPQNASYTAGYSTRCLKILDLAILILVCQASAAVYGESEPGDLHGINGSTIRLHNTFKTANPTGGGCGGPGCTQCQQECTRWFTPTPGIFRGRRLLKHQNAATFDRYVTESKSRSSSSSSSSSIDTSVRRLKTFLGPPGSSSGSCISSSTTCIACALGWCLYKSIPLSSTYTASCGECLQ
jgi:hypothetical protein